MQSAIVQGFRISPQQRHLWPLLGELGEPGAGGVLTAQLTVSLAGPVEAARLRSALERVAARHEALRTRFRRRRGDRFPLQVVQETAAARWREVDVPAEDLAQWNAACDRAAVAERTEVFDLEEGPLLRLLLLRGSADLTALVITLPSLLADAATLRILLREAVDLYAERSPAVEDEEVVAALDALGMPMPDASALPAEDGRTRRTDDFAWLHGQFTMVARSEAAATW